MKTAIVYVNSHHENLKYVREAERSAMSFQRYLPDADYLLFTDVDDFKSDVFSKILIRPFVVPESLQTRNHLNGQMAVKLTALAALDGYDRVMYLGSDTYALSEEVASLFLILDRFDIAAAHAPYRINTSNGNSSLPEVPICFPEFNCDLLLYRATSDVMDFLQQWNETYISDAVDHPHDQGAFRWLAYFSNLRIATLPPEYNYRGRTFRPDTIILQRREKLAQYIKYGARAPTFVRRLNQLFRRVKLPLKISLT